MIRLLYKPDLTQIVEIEKITQISPWTMETFSRCWDVGYRGWVIEENNQIIAFIIVSYQAREAHILNLCVHPQYQRQGLGKQLMDQALTNARAQSIGMSFLEVRRSNSKAIALYEKLGYVQIGERKQYYPASEGREDALLFAKDLRVQ